MRNSLVFSLLLLLGLSLNAQIKDEVDSDIIEATKTDSSLDRYKPVSQIISADFNPIYADARRTPHERAVDLLKHLTFEEKIKLTGGHLGFQMPPIDRLGLRPVFTADASQGIRLGTIILKNQLSTSFPGMMPLASTWNTSLAADFGKAIGEECRALGIDILLGPGINIQRLSVGGRNFEYMGEDPYLATEISLNYIKTLESMGILACPKHYIGNDQEFTRHISNSIISERALREIYLPPWKSAIEKAGVSAIMTGNNLANGYPSVMNKPLNADLLRKEFNFMGIAMSDWQNTNYHPDKQNLFLPSGQTLLMPNNDNFSNWVLAEIKDNQERKDEIESMLNTVVYYNLYTLFRKGIYDRNPQSNSFFETFDAHKQLAREVAEESIILLKNKDNILPITSRNKRIVFYGDPELHSGNGSGFVDGYDHMSYADGLKKVYGNNFEWIATLDKEKIRKADIVFYNFNKTSGEGHDIPYELGEENGKEIEAIAKLNKNVIVLLNAANVMPMSWLPSVKGVFWCSYLGQERGNALANIVSGLVSPSGKLPFTIEKDFADSPDPTYNYIGGKPYWFGSNEEYKNYWLGHGEMKDKAFSDHIKPFEIIPEPYKEDIFIGYRWYDQHNIPVHFSFGFGLSYSSFEINNMKVEDDFSDTGKIIVSIDVKNLGKKEAKEVVQLYVSSKNGAVVRAPKELKSFTKIKLDPKEKQTLHFVLDRDAFAYWDEGIHSWKMEAGLYELKVGNSSQNIAAVQNVNITKSASWR